ncbi:MAG: hypothetical protein OEU54_17710, partial [Gemmatimonadota bacterium]|nr:hypothetical protein [Gemmatimonadota bacterium]
MPRSSLRCCRVALVALLLAPLPTPSEAFPLGIELVGQVGLISPIDPTVVAPLSAHGVLELAPVTAFIIWETTTPGVIDPVTGKTVYDGAVLDAEIQIGTYSVMHAPGMPVDDQNTVIVGDDKEAIASPDITDTILAFAGGLDTDGILSPEPPADEGVSMAFGFQGDTSVLMNQTLLVDQE